jgi:hypothetical protein
MEQMTEEQIEQAFKTSPTLRKTWADRIGVDVSDERVIYGWKEHFTWFYEGWCAALNQIGEHNGI